MTWLSGGELGSGWTSSSYPGFGILFENLPATGENGGSPLLNDGGVNGDEVRWELLTNSANAIIYEDGSFESDVGSFTYRSYVNNVAVGDFTVTVNAAGTHYTITCESISDAHLAGDVAFYRGYNLIADSVTDSHTANAVTLTYTMPSGTAYVLTCESLTDTHQAGAVTFLRGYNLIAGAVTDNHLALPVTLRYSGEEIVLITTYSVNYKQLDVGAAYKQNLIEVTYGSR